MAQTALNVRPSLRSEAWLRAGPTQATLACLSAAGHQARVVGGAVRNALLGRAVADIDIATTAMPDEVIAAATAAGLKWAGTGLKHGTVTLIAGGQPFEVTTLRRDVSTDGRNATVAFTHDWAVDASRRDLTLNALYCDADGTVFDPLGGMADLVAGRVRFIGDAQLRIAEDYLRILRFFRFTAEYAAGPPDHDGMAACVAGRAGLALLSAERVRAEFLRLLTAGRTMPVLTAMAENGLLTLLVPAAPRLGVLARLIAIETSTGRPPHASLRLAALAVAVREDAPRLTSRLRLTNAEARCLEAAAVSIASPGLATDERNNRAVLYQLGPDGYVDRVLLAWACGMAAPADAAWRTILELPRRWVAPKLPFSGRELLARGETSGPKIGEILHRFEAWWIAADFTDDQVRANAEIEALIAEI